MATDLNWQIVRPGVLTNWAASGNYTVLTRPGEWRNGIVARADVADFIVNRIEADAFNREKPVIIRYPLCVRGIVLGRLWPVSVVWLCSLLVRS